jgi:hypothetical protein
MQKAEALPSSFFVKRDGHNTNAMINVVQFASSIINT